MGCGDSCPYLKAETRIEWDIPDPKNLTKGEFREVIEKIEEKVENLIQKLI
jgi:protein-tyrosine-phosphatase